MINMERKDLYDISWQVDEETYRDDPALSYSTLAKFERSGFNGLQTLFDKIESPSLTFGSAVDALMTGGQKEFDSKFVVAEFPAVSDTIESIVKDLFTEFHITHSKLTDIPDVEIIGRAANYNYQNNWKPETRAKVIKEKASEYYSLLFLCEGKELLDNETYQKVLDCVRALKESKATEKYFAEDSMFDDSIKHYYQLKFKATLDNVDYRCRADLVSVDYVNKTVLPCDLKTSGHKEWDFPKSFIQWNYQIQARLYYRIIEDNLKKDPFFKDFKLLPYKFIVVNKDSLIPLVWSFPWTVASGELNFSTKSGENIILRDPFTIGKELSYYLSTEHIVPSGISLVGDNDLIQAFNDM